MKGYQLKITIKDSHPPIWRRVIVPAGLSFSQLSIVINEVMDWSGAHSFCFEFYKLGLRIEEQDDDFECWDMDSDEASEVMIDAYLDREKQFTYVYDFGDDWRHAVVVEKILEDYDKNYPVVLKFKGETPIEDCGGIYGFYDKQRILENPSDPEYEDIREWAVGGLTDIFELEEMNGRLERLCLTEEKSEPMRQREIYMELFNRGTGFKCIQGVNEYIGDEDFDEFGDGNEIGDTEELLRQLEERLKKMEKEAELHFSQNVFGQKDGTLREIYQDYNKEDLVGLAKLHCLGGYSKFRKDELIEFLIYNLLDKDVMCRYFTFLSDEELAIIDKFSDLTRHIEATMEEMDDAMALFAGGYAGSHSLNDIVVPKEVAEAYKKNCDKEWKRLRREALELSYYLNAAAELYGICPMDKALEIYRKHTGKEVDELTMYTFCGMIPENKKAYIYNGVQLIHKSYLDDAAREKLEREQEGKPFYMPTKKEVLALGKDGYLPFDDSMKAVESFLNVFFGEISGYAEDLCRYAQYRMRAGADVGEIMDFMEDNDIFDEIYDREAIEKFKQLLIKAWHRTRKMCNRGNLPKGMTRQERESITSNTKTQGKTNVVRFPIDINRKIYPNDLCPCGSGKKYKKCCGRNK